MRRLYRSRKDRVISGICGGVGEYFKVDPVIVRVAAVFLILTGGIGVIAYIVGIFIIPEAPVGESGSEDVAGPESASALEAKPVKAAEAQPASNSGPVLFGLILVILGAFFLLRSILVFSHYYWWIRDQMHVFFWPGILIGVGLFLILRNSKR